MNTTFLLMSMVLAPSGNAVDFPKVVVRSTGFISLGWVFGAGKRDLYDLWAKGLSDDAKLKGSVAKYLDWPQVAQVVVIYNLWHLPGFGKDIRFRHIKDNLSRASFGDRFKGQNPGGMYVFLLQYKDSDRQVLLSFKDGLFVIEGNGGIGVVDIRKEP